MDRRTKILAGAFGVMIALGFIDRVIWPKWITPLLSIDDRIATEQMRLDLLQTEQDAVNRAVEEYKELIARAGSLDAGRVQTAVVARINKLVDARHLQDVNITPGRPRADRKTGLQRMVITVKAVGALRDALGFLKDVAELPQLVRVGTAAMNPTSGSRIGRRRRRINLRVPIEVLVPSKQKLVGAIDESKLTPPPVAPRHQGRDYLTIADLKPFSEYVPPRPLRAIAGKDIRVKPGQKRVKLEGSATGGEGEYTFTWDPPEHLKDARSAKTGVDTGEEFDVNYTLTVKDETGNTATDTVRVNVKTSPKPAVVKAKPERPRKASRPVDPRWKDRKYMQVRMALLCSTEADRTDELAIYNNREKRLVYYRVGDAFNGGTLAFVHPTGAIVRRSGDYFVHPIGTFLDEEIPAAEIDESFAMNYPQLSRAAEWFEQRDGAKTGPERSEGQAAPSMPAAKGSKEALKAAPRKRGEDAVRRAASQRKRRDARDRETRRRRSTRRGQRNGSDTREYPPLPPEILERLIEEAAKKKQQPDGEKEADDDDQTKDESDKP